MRALPWIATLLALVLLAPAARTQPALEDGMGFLQKHDAERLEAFVLAENLVDFAARSGSARAYLMAAELRLLYPVKRDGEKVEPVDFLLERARALAPDDTGVQEWAAKLARLAAKSPRGEGAFRRLDLRLGPDEAARRSLLAASGQRLVVLPRIAKGEVLLTIQDPEGRALASTEEPGLYFQADQPVTLELLNRGPLPLELTVLYR